MCFTLTQVLNITLVVHKANIEVNEEGAEALLGSWHFPNSGSGLHVMNIINIKCLTKLLTINNYYKAVEFDLNIHATRKLLKKFRFATHNTENLCLPTISRMR